MPRYGRYLLIRHDGRHQTLYAHLHRFAPGLAPGSRVRRGQIIAAVGSSGRSTGPHLHFELRVRGRKVDPLRYRFTAPPILATRAQ